MIPILLITHREIGKSLLACAVDIMPQNLEATAAFGTQPNQPLDQMQLHSRHLIQSLDQGEGVLILTDLCGATPSNLAHHIADEKTSIITGVNLSMLLKALQYRKHMDLSQLTQKLMENLSDHTVLLHSPGPCTNRPTPHSACTN